MELGWPIGLLETRMSGLELSEWIAFVTVREERRKQDSQTSLGGTPQAATKENFAALLNIPLE